MKTWLFTFFLGTVYLLHKGQIVSDHTLFRVEELEGVHNGLHCTVDNSRLTMESPQGVWYYPNGTKVECDSQSDDSGPLHCRLSSDAKSVILYTEPYLNQSLADLTWDGAYSCCYPGPCDTGNNSHVTVRIYGRFMSLFTKKWTRKLEYLLNFPFSW